LFSLVLTLYMVPGLYSYMSREKKEGSEEVRTEGNVNDPLSA